MRVVKGGRYMLAFGGKWEQGKEYEALTMVESYGFSYISRKPVPKDIDISNREYWYRVASTIAQIEQLQEMLEQGTTGAGTLYSSQYDIKESNEDNSIQFENLFNDAILQNKSVYIEKGDYYCTKPITIKFDTLCNSKRELVVYGNLSSLHFKQCNGLKLIIDNNGVDADGNTQQWHYFGKFTIKDLNLIGEGTSTETIGLIIGDSIGKFDAIPNYNILDNVCVQGFGEGIALYNTRHISFNNIVLRDLKGGNGKSCVRLEVHSTSSQRFTGDLLFTNCEFVARGVQHCVVADGTRTENLSIVAGLHFSHCIFYGNDTSNQALIVGASKNIRFMDILVNECQIDQHPNGAFIYSYGWADDTTKQPFNYALRYQITVKGCWFTNVKYILDSNYTYGVVIEGNNALQMHGICTGYYNYNMSVCNNVIRRVTGRTLCSGG